MPKKKVKLQVDNCNYNAQIFCFRNGYRVFPVTNLQNKIYKIHIERGVDKFIDSTEYTHSNVYQGIWDMYQLIYNKKNGKT